MAGSGRAVQARARTASMLVKRTRADPAMRPGHGKREGEDFAPSRGLLLRRSNERVAPDEGGPLERHIWEAARSSFGSRSVLDGERLRRRGLFRVLAGGRGARVVLIGRAFTLSTDRSATSRRGWPGGRYRPLDLPAAAPRRRLAVALDQRGEAARGGGRRRRLQPACREARARDFTSAPSEDGDDAAARAPRRFFSLLGDGRSARSTRGSTARGA